MQVSILTVKGNNCKVDDLMVLSQETGGMVARVDPLNLDQELSDVLQDMVFSKEANLEVQLSSEIRFRNPSDDQQLNDQNTMLK